MATATVSTRLLASHGPVSRAIAAMRSESLGGLRALPVLSDNMEPTFRRGDYAIVHPVTDYQGEGVYACMDTYGTPGLYRFERCGQSRVRMWSDNQLYSRFEISSDEFLAIVLAKVVFKANVMDRRFVPEELRV